MPPLAVTVWLYATPTVVDGRLAGLTVIAALIVTEYACSAVAPTVSVAVTVKLNVPPDDGVPVIAPVDPFRDRPVGNEPAVTANAEAPVPPVAPTVWL